MFKDFKQTLFFMISRYIIKLFFSYDIYSCIRKVLTVVDLVSSQVLG